MRSPLLSDGRLLYVVSKGTERVGSQAGGGHDMHDDDDESSEG